MTMADATGGEAANGNKQKNKARRSGIMNVVAIVCLLAGALLLFAPLVTSAINQVAMDKEIAKVEELYTADGAKDDNATTSDNDSAGADGSQTSDGKQQDKARSNDSSASDNTASNKSTAAARKQLERYNKQVATGKISIASDPFSFESVISEFGSQGLGDGLVGYIKIPSMNCRLPLYLGASSEHMLKGAAVVSGSSAPLGETSSNCVIAAHRGYGSAAMFRDIEKPAKGDKVIVCTLWEKLSYTVVNTKVIRPTDTTAVGVQQGKDMVTLVTCHPYGHNEFRYVVECERSIALTTLGDDSSDDTSSLTEETAGKRKLSLPEIEDYLRVAGGVVLLACVGILIARLVRSKRRDGASGKAREDEVVSASAPPDVFDGTNL